MKTTLAHQTNPNHNQQGDVLLLKVDRLPQGSKLVKSSPTGGTILAESQVTSHRHQILDRSVKLFAAPSGKRYLVNEGEESAELVHTKDHKPILIPPGIHKIGFVQERDHFANLTRAALD